MVSVKVLTISAVLTAIVALSNADPLARMTGGQTVDSLSQFPHHVYIVPHNSGRKCGGSILNSHWVLTSAACIKSSIRLEMHFGKKNELNIAAGYYTVSVNSDEIYVYPTNQDDLALIRLPTSLVFSDTIMPVNISKQTIDGLRNRFSVLPGFPSEKVPTTTTPKVPTVTTKAPVTTVDDYLKYGMFNVLDNKLCKQTIGSKFDEYNQLCTEGWGGNVNTPCDSDFGTGLIIGWPAKSELIGMFSMFSSSCDVNKPSVYTYVPKYLTWIESMIQG